MFRTRSIQSTLNFREKIMSIDYILVLSVLTLGIISMFTMYSTDGGVFDYHTKNHIIRFFLFFSLFLIFSLFQIRFWFSIYKHNFSEEQFRFYNPCKFSILFILCY